MKKLKYLVASFLIIYPVIILGALVYKEDRTVVYAFIGFMSFIAGFLWLLWLLSDPKRDRRF